jgi:cytochrome c-type biogenesis protein CcsB
LLKARLERAYAARPQPALAGGTPATLYVERDTPNLERAAEQGDQIALWMNTLPSLPKMDIFIYRMIGIGVPLLTVGIITGAWWAKEAWGAYWQWDPKETAALFSWIIYASYLHLNTRRAWKGERCAWVSLLGFASIIFCYLGVNIWISGLHSYKM